ncbi:lipocalin-like domain-containing protein [Janthinobacterium sp. SUN118]|uniref:lipocalin-like domain-containing protein n=1 Tax=Janthinobacterium sp. SUN118 TaxID=3004100 RepID=UPI0025B1BAE5|nr:lipocalin-like domain-containing protein [Janthinobacterium sp. SUN118]MDN2708422.1 lipocalin-like domain-containing protein [Janthinobacterium sp. SUN118]
MSGTLREQLIGTWQLQSYTETAVGESHASYPMGEDAQGTILYAPDGYMAAQLMRRGRKPFPGGDLYQASADEFRDAASAYLSYSGPYHVDEQQGLLSHYVELSLFPNWIGQVQQRVARLDGDILHLSTYKPMLAHGREVIAHLRWKRAVAPAKPA